MLARRTTQDGLHLTLTQPELIQQVCYSLELRNDAIRENAFTILNVRARNPR